MLADERGDWHPMGDPTEPAAPAGGAAGQLEAAVLDVLQHAGSALSPGEVRERVGGDLAYTTVVTILSRLHAKGLLSRYKDGACPPVRARRRPARARRPADGPRAR